MNLIWLSKVLNEFLLRIRIYYREHPLLYKDVFEGILFTVALSSIDRHCSRNKRRRSWNLFTIYAKCSVGTTSTTNWLSIRRRYGNVLLLYEYIRYRIYGDSYLQQAQSMTDTICSMHVVTRIFIQNRMCDWYFSEERNSNVKVLHAR